MHALHPSQLQDGEGVSFRSTVGGYSPGQKVPFVAHLVRGVRTSCLTQKLQHTVVHVELVRE